MKRKTEIINVFFLKPMIVWGRQCIVIMHESGLVLRADKFDDLIGQLGELQVERLDDLTILIGDVIILL